MMRNGLGVTVEMPARTVTMDDIAAAAGVSKYAVSKALSGQPGVSEQTREKILRIAAELGYFNQQRVKRKYQRAADGGQPPAQTGSKRNKKSVMVLMSNIRMQSVHSSYWGRIIDGIHDALTQQGLPVFIATDTLEEHLAEVINSHRLFGAIVVGAISSAMLLTVRRMDVPVVMVDHEDPSFPCDTVFVDNLDAAYRMTSYLIETGHRHLQFVGDAHFSRSFQERWLGFRLALEEHGLAVEEDPRLQHISPLMDGRDRSVLKEVLHERSMRSAENGTAAAWVCANDKIALGVLDICRSLDIRVPEQLSITGFDNIVEAEQATPSLTTVHVPKDDLGRRAVEMLLRRAQRPDAPKERVSLRAESVHRQSVASVHAHAEPEPVAGG